MTGWANELTNRQTSNSFEKIRNALPQAKCIDQRSTGWSESTITGQSESMNSESGATAASNELGETTYRKNRIFRKYAEKNERVANRKSVRKETR